MKIKIEYEFDPMFESSQPYWAKSGAIVRCGASYAEAKERLLQHFRDMERVKQVPVPAPEEVEI